MAPSFDAAGDVPQPADVTRVTDGVELSDTRIPLIDDRREHLIEVDFG